MHFAPAAGFLTYHRHWNCHIYMFTTYLGYYYLREHIGLRPFFAISYPRVLKVFLRVCQKNGLKIFFKLLRGFPPPEWQPYWI